MTDNEKRPPVVIAGLNNAGKTTFICTLIQLGYRSNLNLAALKPFDNSLLYRNAEELPSDGALFCQQMTGDPMETLVSPYIAHEQYPIEMAFRRDGIGINMGFLNERLGILGDLYDLTLLELPGGICTPIKEEKTVSNWLTELKYRVIMVLNSAGDQFEQNLAQITLLKGLNLEMELVINNTAPIEDQDLLFYMWEKYEQLAELEIAGMIPYIRDLEQDYTQMTDKLASALPNLIGSLFNA